MKTLTLIFITMAAAGAMLFTSCKKDVIEKPGEDANNSSTAKSEEVTIEITMGTTAMSYMHSIKVECDCEVIQGDNMRMIIASMKPGQKLKSVLKDLIGSYNPGYMGSIGYKVYVPGRSKTTAVHQEFRNDLVFEYTHK